MRRELNASNLLDIGGGEVLRLLHPEDGDFDAGVT